MPSRRALIKQSQKKQKQEQRKKASDIRAKKRAAAAVLSNKKPEKRARTLKSPVWKTFNYKRKEDGSEDQSIVVCGQCNAEFSKASGTSSMINHLSAVHKDYWNQISSGKVYCRSRNTKNTKYMNTLKEWK